MSDDVRFQRKCYFASPEYADSFWGKFIYLYQGKGSLRLTADALLLEDGPRPVKIPLSSVTSVESGRFSSWSKPFGLSRLTVRYTGDGEPRTIHLVPFESGFDPTWVTSEIVASWQETLRGVEGLAGRVGPVSAVPVPPSPGKKMALVGLMVFVLPVAVLALVGWFILGS